MICPPSQTENCQKFPNIVENQLNPYFPEKNNQFGALLAYNIA